MMTRSLIRIIAIHLLTACAVIAGVEDHLAFKSPNGKWRIVANWTDEAHGGYVWELQDIRTKKSYFKQDKIEANEMLPRRFFALWSPDSRRVAVNSYYGRIAYDVFMIDTAGGEGREIPLFPKTVHNDDCTSANRWRNNSDLELEVFHPTGGVSGPFHDLVIRFGEHGSRVIKGHVPKTGN